MKNERIWKRCLMGILAVGSAVALSASVYAMGGQTETERAQQSRDAVAEEELTAENSMDTRALSPNRWAKIDGKCYNGSGQVIPGAITRGIDVSFWQGEIDWDAVAGDNVDFAFIRAGGYGGTTYDSQYVNNMKGANAAGLPVGVYYYSTAKTTEQALADAQWVIEKMRGYKVSYPVVVDMEDGSLTSLSPTLLSELAKTFCDEIEKAGYYPMIYCNTNWYKNYLVPSIISGIDVWIASYGDKIMAPSGNYYTIWQATDGDGGGTMNPTMGLIDGIDPYNNVDIDFGFTDYTKIIVPRTAPVSTYEPTVDPSKKNGFVTENGYKYYYQNGVKVKGKWVKDNGKYYYFTKNTGLMVTSTLLANSDKSVIYYVNRYGERVTNLLGTVNGDKYYFGTTGNAVRGWKGTKGNFYYFNPSDGKMVKNKFITSSLGTRYVKADGVMVDTYGTFNVGNNTYFALGKNNGYFIQKGWLQTKAGNWYYFTLGTGIMLKNTTLTNTAGYTYKFSASGRCTNKI